MRTARIRAAHPPTPQRCLRNPSQRTRTTISRQVIRLFLSDDFIADQDGEFPAHWHLDGGQGVVNSVQGTPAFCLTQGNYVVVSPRMKTESYLSDPFTVEFDYLANAGYPPGIRFTDSKNDIHDLHFGSTVSTSYFPNNLSGSDVESDANYKGKWHHAAMIYKNGQMKAYLDNSRALVVPECGFVPVSLKIIGIGDPDQPITFKNFRVANGGNANTIASLIRTGSSSHTVLRSMLAKPHSVPKAWAH